MSGTVVTALIPARAGSKGVPGKNTLPIGRAGHSLVERAILTAIEVPELSSIYVTTNDMVAAKQATAHGVDLIWRPDALADDDTPMLQVVKHALGIIKPQPDIIVLLQPTTPSRSWQMVQDAIQVLIRRPEVDSVVSVVPVPLTHSPEMVMTIREGDLNFYAPSSHVPTRRQDAQRVFARDGSVYAFRTESMRQYNNLYGRKMQPYLVHPSESLNIDTSADWERAQHLLQ